MIDITDRELVQNIIFEAYSAPIHKGLTVEKDALSILKTSNICADELTLQLKIDDKVITSAKFDGSGCMVSCASAEIMAAQLMGKNVIDALKCIENYQNLASNKDYDRNLLGELEVFTDVVSRAKRAACAMLSVEGYKEILEKEAI